MFPRELFETSTIESSLVNKIILRNSFQSRHWGIHILLRFPILTNEHHISSYAFNLQNFAYFQFNDNSTTSIYSKLFNNPLVKYVRTIFSLNVYHTHPSQQYTLFLEYDIITVQQLSFVNNNPPTYIHTLYQNTHCFLSSKSTLPTHGSSLFLI